MADKTHGISSTLARVARRLFPDEAARADFIAALQQPREYSPAVMWMKERPAETPFDLSPAPSWLPDFVDWVAPGQRPGQHSAHEAGDFYCLDISSVFAATVLTAVPKELPVVVDLCASPGGKSLFAWRALRPGLLISNETIRKRTGALISNLQRCQVSPAVVTSMDSAIMGQILPAGANVIIVDAPCSGQSLIAKGHEAPGCFHESTINLNANRQRRILAHATSALASGGYLAYITCTYAEKENEDTVKWLRKRFPQLEPVSVPALASHQSQLADFPCYRMWPQDGLGAGAFACLLRHHGPAEIPEWPEIPILRPVWSAGVSI